MDDHGIPVKEGVREKWDKNVLTGLDKEIKEIISFYRKNIIEESKELINDLEKGKVSKISEIIEQEIDGNWLQKD